MNDHQAFVRYLSKKGRKQAYIDACIELIDALYASFSGKPPTSDAIDAFVRKRWSGYVSRDRATYQMLSDYADFCAAEAPLFTNAFREHIRITFEGEARKAMRAYKRNIVLIPQGAKIDASFLDWLTTDAFAAAFRSLQELLYSIYDDIEHGSPFDWGWPDWQAITAEGLEQNRVMLVLQALACSGDMDGDALVVDKKRFGEYGINKPIAKTKMLFEKLAAKGFCIDGFNDKSAASFTASYPGVPNLMFVLCAYFKNRCDDEHQNHRHALSYRFVEDPATQAYETFFLAKTDGEPEKLREMYYWLYHEAVKHGFTPQGYENMGCYVYKSGKKEWLLLGSGSSYHEDEFLHSPHYALAAKVLLHRVFETHPEQINALRKAFPASFGRPWTGCFECKADYVTCKNRVTFKKDGCDYHHCGTKHHLYFHDPDLAGLKTILALYKAENNITQPTEKEPIPCALK